MILYFFFGGGADWAVRAVLKISKEIIKPPTFEGFFMFFFSFLTDT